MAQAHRDDLLMVEPGFAVKHRGYRHISLFDDLYPLLPGPSEKNAFQLVDYPSEVLGSPYSLGVAVDPRVAKYVGSPDCVQRAADESSGECSEKNPFAVT